MNVVKRHLFEAAKMIKEVFFPSAIEIIKKIGIKNDSDISGCLNLALQCFFDNLQNGKYQYKSNLKTYYCSIAKYKALDIIRKRGRDDKRNQRIDDEQKRHKKNHDNPDSFGHLEEELRELIKLLPENKQYVLQKFYIDKMTLKEIAMTLKRPSDDEKTVYERCKKNLQRGREAIKKFLL